MNIVEQDDGCRVPEVSVIIPVHNVAAYIEQTLASVLGQVGFDNFEVLVVNDRSTDDTPALVAAIGEKDSRLRLVDNEGKRGVAAARNLGLKLARGRWIAFLDGDDLWMPRNLYLKMAASDAHPGFDVISSDFINENRFNRELPRAEWPAARQSLLPSWVAQLGEPPFWKDAMEGTDSHIPVIELSDPLPRFLAGEVLGHTGTFVVCRRLIEEIGDFDTSLEVGEDIFMWMMVALYAGRMLFVHCPLMYYRWRPTSLTNQEYPAHAFFAERYLRQLEGKAEFVPYRKLVRRRLRRALIRQCYYLRSVGRFREALWKGAMAIKLGPADGTAWRNLLAALAGR